MHRPVALLTDFGLEDPYVGQLKGALAAYGPCVPIIDLCHNVLPHNTLQAGFILRSSFEHFPSGTVFVSVVDPGVGGARRIIILDAMDRFFLAPDNGLLSLVLEAATDPLAYAVDQTHFPRASSTFHGRDIFVPLAVRLALGATPATLAKPVDTTSLTRLPHLQATITHSGMIAQVVHVDRFGNCLLNTDIRSWQERAASAGILQLELGPPLLSVDTYESLGAGEVGILAGSQGVMELAMNQHSAARRLDLRPGAEVRILFTPGGAS
jgi:S-adenosyl-L-methionine hydrolase (adenosine-forming)